MLALSIPSLMLVLFLAADAVGLAAAPLVFRTPGLMAAYHGIKILAYVLSAPLAILCALRGLKAREQKDPRVGWWWALAATLLLSLFAAIFRGGLLVRATSRAPEDHFPCGAVLWGLAAGFLCWRLAAGSRAKRLGLLVGIAFPVAAVLAFGAGLRVDYQAITDKRAARIGQALERYRLDTGAYPTRLASLTPGYLPVILGPVNGRGKVWCYQSTPTGYRLGYVIFQRYYDWPDGTPFYESFYEIRIPSTGGQPPQGGWMCDEELERYKANPTL